MIFVTLNILFLLFLFTGIGLLFPWNTFRHERRLNALLLCFWTGWAVAIAFLQVWHFIFPASLGAFIVLMAAGAAGWWHSRALAAETVRRWNRPQALALAGLALIPGAMLANHVLFNSPNSDYALYHLQTIRWYAQYAIVPGMGNVFNPLAWNGSSFLYTAAIDSGWLYGRAYYVSNSLPAYAAILQTAAGLYGLFTRRPLRYSDLYYALMIPVIMLQASTAYIVAYSPDPLMFFLQIVVAGHLVALFDDGIDWERYKSRSAELVLLTATGVVVKLSFALFGALCLLVMVITGILRYQSWPWRRPRLWWGWIALGMALILPWMGRSVLLSGYLIFPNTAISFPVVWKIPPALADAAQTVIVLWAKTVNGSIEYTADLAWFAEWLRVFPFFVKQTFVIAVGLLLFDLLLWILLRRHWLGHPEATGTQPVQGGPVLHAAAGEPAAPAQDLLRWDPGFVLALIVVPSLVFWFVMGPSYRFSGALFWLLLVAALMAGFRLLASTALITRPEVLGLCLVLGMALWMSPNHFSNNLSRQLLLIPPTESALAEQAMPRAGLRQRTTASGLVVNIPREGVEECWDAPLPCTTAPNFLPGLRELVPGNPQKGYALQLDD